MKKTDQNKFRKLIMKERDDLVSELGFMKETAIDESSRESSGDSSNYSYHMADMGTDSQEREKAYLFLARENKYLGYLNEALERITRGEYGACRNCGKDIPKARLEAVLHATLCVPCKEEAKANG